MVIVIDDEERENEGDLMLAAQFVTPEAINFMLRQAAGYLFLALTDADCDRLQLHPQTPTNTSAHGTPLTVTIDGHPKHGFTTGVSAPERARTIQLAINPDTGPDDFVRPGHVNPLRGRPGGVLVRAGHTEALVDLCRLAGLQPAAIGIEVCRSDGEMARLPDLERFCAQHGLKMCSIAQLIEHRLSSESLVSRLEPFAGQLIHTVEGDFTALAFRSAVDPLPHIVLTTGDVGLVNSAGVPVPTDKPTLVRMHSCNLLDDVFGVVEPSPQGCTSHALWSSMRAIKNAGRGAVIYLRHPNGEVPAHFSSFASAFSQHSLAPAQQVSPLPGAAEGGNPEGSGIHREFGIGCQIIRQLGLRKLRLLTNHPRSRPGIKAFGIEIVEHVPLPPYPDR
jgi:3,4-dihydroxy 2-butanone 4-phosphate synthase/GTP cyclohydrolase II